MSSSAASNSSSNSSSKSGSADMNSSTGISKLPLYGIIVCAGLGIISYIVSFYMTSQLLGGTEHWNQIQPTFASIYGAALGGCILLCIALGIYINQMLTNPNVLYIIMVISVLALCFSYTAVAMAVITKSA